MVGILTVEIAPKKATTVKEFLNTVEEAKKLAWKEIRKFHKTAFGNGWEVCEVTESGGGEMLSDFSGNISRKKILEAIGNIKSSGRNQYFIQGRWEGADSLYHYANSDWIDGEICYWSVDVPRDWLVVT